MSLPTPLECRKMWLETKDEIYALQETLVKFRDAQIIARLEELGKEKCECADYHKNSEEKDEHPEFTCAVCDFVKLIQNELRGEQQ